MLGLIKLLVGLAAIVALGALAMTMEGVPGSAISAEARLQEKVGAALSSNGADWASVSMDGQKAVITGEAPSEEARKVVYDAIAQSTGSGGLVFGGVTIIDDSELSAISLPPIANPFLWIAEHQDGTLLLSGFTPSEHYKTELLSHARLRFPETDIADTMEVARGAPFEEHWLRAASLSLDALARLNNGAVESNGAQFTLTGETEEPSVSRNVALLMSALPAQFTGEANVRYTGDVNPAVTSTALIEAEQPVEETSDAIATTEASAIETCRTQLSETIASQAISFASSSRQLDEASLTNLRPLAEGLRDCPQFHLEITGHTDSTGERARNLRLSENRAAAVATFLTSLGIEAARLDANGLGDAEPLFSNDTLQGRAGNRRIEFALTIPSQPTTE